MMHTHWYLMEEFAHGYGKKASIRIRGFFSTALLQTPCEAPNDFSAVQFIPLYKRNDGYVITDLPGELPGWIRLMVHSPLSESGLYQMLRRSCLQLHHR